MKIFVTGGAGFIGSSLVGKLLEKGFQVTIFDNFSNNSIENIQPLLEKEAKLVRGDIINFDSLQKSLNGYESVVHLAAKIDVKESVIKPKLYHKVNVVGTKNILDTCIKNRIKNVIAASSAAVFGNSNKLPLTEDSIFCQPRLMVKPK